MVSNITQESDLSSSGAYGWLESTSSPQHSVLLFLHKKICLSRITLHIALFFVLSDYRYFLSHQAASAIGALSHIRCPASELSGGRGYASGNS